MDPLDALYLTAHEYPGGVEALARRMGRSPAALRQALLRRYTTHKVQFEDFIRILDLTGDLRALHALCGRHGGIFLPVDTSGDTGDLVALLLEKDRRSGDLAAEVHAAIEDRRVSFNELCRVQSAIARLQAVLDRIVRFVHTLHETGKPDGVEG